MLRYSALVLLLPTFWAAAQPAELPSCARDAVSRAAPLLALHFGEANQISIADEVKELPSIRNPANPEQRFSVYEVWGYIYKGEYRMRFIYYRAPESGCVLMGQEVLEIAKL